MSILIPIDSSPSTIIDNKNGAIEAPFIYRLLLAGN